MSKTKKLETIYVELDAILDTRLGTISKINSDIASSLLLSEKYHTRDEDAFVGIDYDLFKEQYRNRDVDTLKRSVITGVLQLVKQLANDLTEQAIQRPFHEGCTIAVNYYPYKLTVEEQEEFRLAIMAWTQKLIPVELISISPTKLTPEYCKNSFSLMVVYEYEDWMNCQSERFKTTRLPEITMLAPAIYFNKKPTSEELEQTVKTVMHPIKALELLASPIINLKLIDVGIFSIIAK